MGRQHVVVGGDDRDVRARSRAQQRLLLRRAAGEAVGEVRAAEVAAGGALHEGGLQAIEVGRARACAASRDPLGDGRDGGVQHLHAANNADDYAKVNP